MMPSYKRGRGKDGKGQDYEGTGKKRNNTANSEFSFSRSSITDVAASRSADSVANQRGFVESAEEAIRKRLIPDLMRVYETITQTSVPTESLNNDETRRNGNSHPQTILENNSHPNDRFDRFNSYSANQQYDDSNQLTLEGIYGYHRETFQQNQGTPYVRHHQPSPNQTHPVSQMQQQRLDVSPRNTTATSYYEHSTQALHNGLIGNRPWTQQDTPKVQNLEKSTEFDSDASSESGSSRKQGSSSDLTKKTDVSDGNQDTHSRSKVGRWTKRFIWPDRLHRDFVSAIFSLGLERCSPSAVLLQIPEATLSIERVQTVLTRYKHHQRFINKIWKNQDVNESNMNRQQTTNINTAQVGRVESNNASLDESKRSSQAPRKVSVSDKRNIATKIKLNGPYQAESFLVLPRLTDAEKDSSMGKCLGHLMALFFHLKQELATQRNENTPGQTQEMNQRTDITSPPPTAAAATQYYQNELEDPNGQAQPAGFDFNSILIRGSLNLNLGSNSAAASVRSELEMLADVSAHPSTTMSIRSENSSSSISTYFRQSRIKTGSDQHHNMDANRSTINLFNYNQMPEYNEGQINRISHESSTNNFDANADQDGIDLSVHDVDALRASAQQASDDQSASTFNDDSQRRPRPRSYSDVTWGEETVSDDQIFQYLLDEG